MSQPITTTLHEKGNALFVDGRYQEATQVFRQAVNDFLQHRTADKAAIEEFVKVAGNLCICYHAMGDFVTCVNTAREMLAIYPIIPKAHGVIGMCIISRLILQEAEERALELDGNQKLPCRTKEEVRRDARRYLVKLGDIQCSVDDAHRCLCRAIVLSDSSLKAALGPYLEATVRWTSEQLLSAGLSLERELGEAALSCVSAIEENPQDPPALLDTVGVKAAEQRVQVIEATEQVNGPAGAQGRPVEDLPEDEASAILRCIEESQQAVAEDEAAQAMANASTYTATDFLLSGRRVGVRICHAERGGIPRGLTLARAKQPYAVAPWMQTSTATVPMTAAPLPISIDTHHVDPVAMGMVESGAAPPLFWCSACGKEVNPLHLSGPVPVGCAACHGVSYCSSACEAIYTERHSRYECPMRLALRRRVDAMEGSASLATPSTSVAEEVMQGDVAPAEAWRSTELHRHTLPLCIAAFSGLCTDAPGSGLLVAQLQRGLPQHLKSLLPAEVLESIACMTSEEVLNGASPIVVPKTIEMLGGASAVLQNLFFIIRLLSERHADSCCSAFYTERLLLRHSCEPNCVWSETQRSIVTCRYICKGEELTLAVDPQFPQHWPWQLRQKWWLCYHGASCNCRRCVREAANLNESRGHLSNEVVEKLLTADIPDHPCPSAHHRYPTQYFHRKVQKAVEQCRGPHPKRTAARRTLESLRQEMGRYLLPTHYLWEDIRQALLTLAVEEEEPAVELTAEGHQSLLFLEAMWSGGIPAKSQTLHKLPSVFDGCRRRKCHPQHQRRRRGRRSNADGQTGATITGGVGDGSGGTDGSSPASAETSRVEEWRQNDGPRSSSSPRALPVAQVLQESLTPTKDFSGDRHVVDLFYGSYQTWYT